MTCSSLHKCLRAQSQHAGQAEKTAEFTYPALSKGWAANWQHEGQ